jgi:amidohydrolase
VRYVFQPAEEGLGGARRMTNEGVLEGVDAALGLHIWLSLPTGVIGVVDGPQMAGSQEFRITVSGRGGHGGLPHETVDSIMIASQIVVALQTVVSRNVSPLESAVVSVGAFHGGMASNVISESAVLDGTIRAFRTEVEETLRERIIAIATGVAESFGARAEVQFGKLLFPPTANAPELADLVRDVAREVVGPDRVRTDPGVRTMAAEDFAEFSTRVPGCYFFLGAYNEEVGATHPHHSPHFNVCEKAMPLGVEILERAALAYLNGQAG